MFEYVRKLPLVEEVKALYPLNRKIASVKAKRDSVISDILLGQDNRMLLIVGPCSMDSEDGIYSYVEKLLQLDQKIGKYFFIVPRLYTSKPRSLNGFQGLIHSPHISLKSLNAPDANCYALETKLNYNYLTAGLNLTSNVLADADYHNMSEGIMLCRKILYCIANDFGLTGADELLYPDLFCYFDDLISYTAVGARSTENQFYRMFASGVDVAVGFKNPLSGNVATLINSICVAKRPNHLAFGGKEYKTNGNSLAHAVFRGYTTKDGRSVFNADLQYYEDFLQKQSQRNLFPIPFLVDASHDNSGKNYLKQGDTLNVIANNLQNPKFKKQFKGLMLESYLVEGKNSDAFVFGRSHTDGCLNYAQTEKILLEFLDKVV